MKKPQTLFKFEMDFLIFMNKVIDRSSTLEEYAENQAILESFCNTQGVSPMDYDGKTKM